jgi:hypothetical protein
MLQPMSLESDFKQTDVILKVITPTHKATACNQAFDCAVALASLFGDIG